MLALKGAMDEEANVLSDAKEMGGSESKSKGEAIWKQGRRAKVTTNEKCGFEI